MTSQIGLLLYEVDKESAQVHQQFGFDRKHRAIDDFSRAISTQRTLDQIVSQDGNLSEVEARVYGVFYSALAFRMIDSSTRYDEEKFKVAGEIIQRAEDLTLSAEPAVHKAKYHLNGRLSKLAPEKRQRVFWHLDKFRDFLRMITSNDYVNLLVDANKIFKLDYFVDNFKKYSQGSLLKGLKRGTNLFGETLYEGLRQIAFLYSSISGVGDLATGDYESGAIKISIAVGIPLSRHIYKRKKVEEILGSDYTMPTLTPVLSNNR